MSSLVPGNDRELADLKMHTDLQTHCLVGMIVLNSFEFELNSAGDNKTTST